MSKKNSKWNYEVRVGYLNMLFLKPPSSISTNSIHTQEMCERLNAINPDQVFKPNDLLCNLFKLFSENKDLTFLQPIIPNGKLVQFFQSKDKFIKLDHQNIKEGLIKAILHVQAFFNLIPKKLNYDAGLSLNENISRMVKNNNLSELEVYATLYNQNDISILKNQPIRNESNETINIPSYPPEPSTDSLDIDILRKKIAKAFNHETKEHNLFLMNDGTGSGKTHNVVMNFIESYPNLLSNKQEKKRKSLIFIAPQKNQLFANDHVFYEAEKAGIPLLFARAKDDVTNLESKNYLDLNKKIKAFNEV